MPEISTVFLRFRFGNLSLQMFFRPTKNWKRFTRPFQRMISMPTKNRFMFCGNQVTWDKGFTSRKIKSSPPENFKFLRRIKNRIPIPSGPSGAFTCWLRLRPRKQQLFQLQEGRITRVQRAEIPEIKELLVGISHPKLPFLVGLVP